MLKIFKGPEAFSCGLEDRFSPEMEKCLNKNGVSCIVTDMWSNFWAYKLFFSSRISRGPGIFRKIVAPINCWTHAMQVGADDVVWITGTSLPISDTRCWFEKKIIRKGAAYIFWIEDDWFSDPALKASAEVRMELADLVIAIAPMLGERIKDLYPGKRVIVLEEPIDVERLKPKENAGDSSEPLLLAGGRPWNLKKLLMIDSVLKKIYRDVQFKLRVITGREKPKLNLSIPWEWVPYDRFKEAEHAKGAIAGLAPLEYTPFNECKGNYKVKSYMAMGIPPVGSAIGYNLHLIRNEETGFLIKTNDEWESVLKKLLTDPGLAIRVGTAARSDIIKRYSYEALMPVWADALQNSFPGKLKC